MNLQSWTCSLFCFCLSSSPRVKSKDGCWTMSRYQRLCFDPPAEIFTCCVSRRSSYYLSGLLSMRLTCVNTMCWHHKGESSFARWTGKSYLNRSVSVLLILTVLKEQRVLCVSFNFTCSSTWMCTPVRRSDFLIGQIWEERCYWSRTQVGESSWGQSRSLSLVWCAQAGERES